MFGEGLNVVITLNNKMDFNFCAKLRLPVYSMPQLIIIYGWRTRVVGSHKVVGFLSMHSLYALN